jgi:hypothetical protein
MKTTGLRWSLRRGSCRFTVAGVMVAGGAALNAGCSTQDSVVIERELAEEQQVGHVHLPLVSPTGTPLRLRNAVFTIANVAASRSLTLNSEATPNARSLDVDLPQDRYTIALQDGWSLEQVGDAGAGAVVRGALLTRNPSDERGAGAALPCECLRTRLGPGARRTWDPPRTVPSSTF